jgi:probable addiction module antidote protein
MSPNMRSLEISLNAALRTADIRTISAAIGTAVRKSLNVSRLADDVGVNRTTLYHSVRSERGGPGLDLTIKILSALGVRLVVEFVRQREPYESRGSRTVLGEPGGESPPGHSTIASALTLCRQLPVSPRKRTWSEPVGMSQRCQSRKWPPSLDHLGAGEYLVEMCSFGQSACRNPGARSFALWRRGPGRVPKLLDVGSNTIVYQRAFVLFSAGSVGRY